MLNSTTATFVLTLVFMGCATRAFFGATYDAETRWQKIRFGFLGVVLLAAGIMFFSVTMQNIHNSVADARDVHICMTTLEQALTEYRADFGTEAVLALSESDNLVPSLAKEYEVNGKRVGPYIYDQTVIDWCSTKKWRIRPMTATTLHIDLMPDEFERSKFEKSWDDFPERMGR